MFIEFVRIFILFFFIVEFSCGENIIFLLFVIFLMFNVVDCLLFIFKNYIVCVFISGKEWENVDDK